MAQTGNFSPIQLYSSSTPGNAPAVGNLVNSTLGSELAINIADGKLFYKDSGNAIQVIAWKTTPTTAGGTGLTSYTAGDMVYWASGTTFTKLGIGATNYIMTSSGTAPQWSASIGPAQGGTGITSYAVGDLIYASGTTTLSKLADVATGNALISGGVATAPSWGKIGLTTHISGTLAVGNGGTGLTTLTAGYIPFGNGTSAFGSTANLFWNSSTNCLGIGTTSGTSKLEVSGTGANNAGARATYEGTIKINEAGSFSLQTTGGLEFKGSVFGAGYGSKIFSTDSGAMLFGYRTNSATWSESMRIHNSGGVSIGNTTDGGVGTLRVNSTFRYGSMFIIHGSNLDTITQCGDYAGYGLTNGPATFPNPAAWLLVEVFNTNDSIIWQRCTDAPYGSSTQKIRGSANGGTTWTAWV